MTDAEKFYKSIGGTIIEDPIIPDTHKLVLHHKVGGHYTMPVWVLTSVCPSGRGGGGRIYPEAFGNGVDRWICETWNGGTRKRTVFFAKRNALRELANFATEEK